MNVMQIRKVIVSKKTDLHYDNFAIIDRIMPSKMIKE